MKRSYPLVAGALAWAVFGTWAEAHRSAIQHEDPALRIGIEADLAARSCPTMRLDTELFRSFLHANHLNHAELYSRKRSATLQLDLDADARSLRQHVDQACARMWERYGSAGSVKPLLAAR